MEKMKRIAALFALGTTLACGTQTPLTQSQTKDIVGPADGKVWDQNALVSTEFLEMIEGHGFLRGSKK